ncbi:hypothetical protein R1flu_003403 [Riccia fluitans]|uniref:Uncharacterized protein n=1 Tax=Riccia fluitans TaxID=41844 RepID=A0ABD1Y8X7_9MARC
MSATNGKRQSNVEPLQPCERPTEGARKLKRRVRGEELERQPGKTEVDVDNSPHGTVSGRQCKRMSEREYAASGAIMAMFARRTLAAGI